MKNLKSLLNHAGMSQRDLIRWIESETGYRVSVKAVHEWCAADHVTSAAHALAIMLIERKNTDNINIAHRWFLLGDNARWGDNIE